MSKFSDWTLAKLEDRFGIELAEDLPALVHWLGQEAEIPEVDRANLLRYQRILAENADAWNEQELAMNFIGPVLAMVEFGHFGRYRLFAERPLSGIVNGEEMSGAPDGLVARGWWEPKLPYFCFHEYKKEVDSSGDPAAQCLAPMLVAREMNEDKRPIYGCYVVGRSWRFMVLEHNQYAISKPFSAADEDLFDIFRALKSLKTIIEAAM
ncbi:MAG: hypothetical protein ACK4Q5_06370 [Saprospiraceae bacterium]